MAPTQARSHISIKGMVMLNSHRDKPTNDHDLARFNIRLSAQSSIQTPMQRTITFAAQIASAQGVIQLKT
jgi:hypothetical protein